MKRILYSLVAIVSLFATSCIKEDISATQIGHEALVSVSVESVSSRAIADGEKANELQYAVYDSEWRLLFTKTVANFSMRTAVEEKLLTGYTYNFVFWAHTAGVYAPVWGTVGEISAPTVTIDYANVAANNDSRDAFFGQVKVTVEGTTHASVDLKRPFAQINHGTNDLVKAKTAGFNTDALTTSLKVSAYNTLYLNGGTVDGLTTAEFVAVEPADDMDKLNTDYDWISMNYILAPADETALDECTLTMTDGSKTIAVKYPQAPARRNYRTNLLGALLTDSANVDVEVKPGTEGDLNNPNGYYIKNGVYHIQNGEGLKWLAEQVNGGNSFSGVKFVLDGDIDLSATSRATTYTEWIPIGTSDHAFSGSFDGSGYTVRNFQVTALEGHAGLFGYITLGGPIQNLTVENVKIVANHYAGGIVGRGYVNIENCHINNVDITLSVKNNDWSDKAGGVIGQMMEGSSTTKNCTAKNVSIKGYRDLGGIAGMAHDNNTVTGCSVENITIVQDLTNGYKSEIPTTLGAVVGRQGSNVTYENNTEKNVNVGTAANNVEELNDALAASDNASIVLAEGTFNVGNGLGNGNAGELTIAGAGIDKTTINAPANQYGNNQNPGLYGNNKDLVFKNLTFVTTNNGYEGGIGHAKSVTFINCKIVGQFYCHSNAPHTFIDCTIDPLTGYLYTWNSDCEFEGCTFEATEGKALQVYGDGPRTNNVSIKNCEFTAAKVAQTWDEKPVTAIDINTANGAQMIVNIKNCEATGFGVGEFSGNGLWNIKSGALNAKAATVIVDGEALCVAGMTTVNGYSKLWVNADKSEYTVFSAEGLIQMHNYWAANTSTNSMWGKTYSIGADIDANGYTWNSVYVVVGHNANNGFVIDGKGHTISNLAINGSLFTGTPNGSYADTTPGVVRNLTFDNATVSNGGFGAAVIWGNTWGEVVFEDVHIVNSSVTGICNVAAFVGATSIEDGGTINPVKFINCSVKNCTITAQGGTGSDPTGASGYVGRAFAKTSLVFEGTNTIDAATVLNNADGLVSGRVYNYTTWANGGFSGTGASDDFVNWNGLN